MTFGKEALQEAKPERARRNPENLKWRLLFGKQSSFLAVTDISGLCVFFFGFQVASREDTLLPSADSLDGQEFYMASVQMCATGFAGIG